MKNKTIGITLGVLLIGAVLVLGACSRAGSGTTGAGTDSRTFSLRLAHGVPETDPLHLAAAEFKRIVEAKTNGRLTIQLFSNSVLGDELALGRSLGDGSLDMTTVASANAQATVPSIGAIMMPYMYTSSEEAWKVLDAVIPALNERAIREGNVRILGFYEKGFRVLTNSRRAVTRLSDLQGLRIRVSPGEIPLETFRSWGIEPIPMAWAEVFTALQQRVIDGQENPYTTIPTSRFDEVQRYVTDIHYMMWTGPLMISERTYQSLPADLQRDMEASAQESIIWLRQYHNDLIEDARRDILAKGMVLSGTPVDEDEWQARAKSIWPRLYDGAGGREWVEYVVGLLD